MATKKLYRIISLINCVGIILSAASFLMAWNSIDIDITKIKTGLGTETPNLNWFAGVSIVFCGVLTVGILVYEFLLVINPTKFKFYNYAIIRVIVYAYLGIAVLGVSGDLGISASAFTLLNAVLNFIIFIGVNCECIKMVDAEPNAYKNADTDDPQRKL